MGEFNLIDEPWIPCILHDNSFQELNLKEIFSQAPLIRKIFDNSPLITFALHRLLLAILHRNFGPKDYEEWMKLWNQKKFNMDILNRYFAQWYDRFFLFHETYPFYQAREPLDAEHHPVWKLGAEYASGHNFTLFDHHYIEKEEIWSYAQTARTLVGFQNFAVAGGHSQPFNLTHAISTSGINLLVFGENLFQSLMINLFCYDAYSPIPNSIDDKPVWEQNTLQLPNQKGTEPLGYLDYLTWQSRRVILHKMNHGCNQIQILRNLKISSEIFDPMKAYRRIKSRGFLPLELDQNRVFWRDSHTLFQFSGDDTRRPQVFNHIVKLKEKGCQDLDRIYWGITICGFAFGETAGKIDLWRQETLPFLINYSYEENLLAALQTSLQLAERVCFLFKKSSPKADYPSPFTILARNFLPLMTKGVSIEEAKRIQVFIDSLNPEQIYWKALEIPFFDHLRQLSDDIITEDGNRIYGIHTQKIWKDTIKRIAREVFDSTTKSLVETARALKAHAIAEKEFNIQLSGILKPFSESGKEVNA